VLNFKKSELVSSQDFTFIGAHINLRDSMVLPTLENCLKVLERIRMFLACPFPTATMWQSLMGSLTSQFRFVPFGQLHLRSLQWHFQDHWDQQEGDP